MRLMVIGCGNSMAGDDSAGLEVLRRLESQGACNCDLRVFPQAGIEILEAFDNAEVILFVDAVSSGASPGTLHLVSLLSTEVGSRVLQALSGHGWSLPETLKLARVLARRIPRLILLGIELEGAILGSSRSTAVNQAIDRVVKCFPVLESWLRSLSASDLPVSRMFSPSDDLLPGEPGRKESETSMPSNEETALGIPRSKETDFASAVS